MRWPIAGRASVFLIATLALGPGVMANAIFKDHWHRPRPPGITKFYGHAQKRLVPFWSRFGIFKPMENGEFYFSDHEYVAMAGQLAPPPDALGLSSDHLVLIRPEGEWDRPGVFDRSLSRPPSNPLGKAA